ncbi:MAG TPA: hotdog domain-containing protein [Terriglobales bacterium]
MARHVPIGVRGEAAETVELKHTLAAHDPRLPPVYSTPDMIRLMEIAAFQALQPFCDDGEITVGISINIEHRAASAVGVRVRAEAELESFDGRFYILRVRAHDGSEEIGRGTVGRAVVHVPSFVKRMREKAGGEQAGKRQFSRGAGKKSNKN